MAKRTGKLAILAGSALVVCFIAGNAMAFGPHHNGGFQGKGGWGMDSYHNGGFQGKGGWGMGPHHEEFFGPHPGFDRFLVDRGVSAETVNAFWNDKDKWRNESADTFKAMRAKGLELYEELSKAQPDAARAKALQGELSQLRAQLDAKRIDNMLYMKKTYPQICEIMQQNFKDREFGPGFGMGKPGPNAGKPGPGPGPR